MTSFILKIIALITMTLDHVKYAIPVTNCFLTQNFGRIAFPIFAFLITEGYIHTKNRKKYIIRLIIFAIISQIPYMLFRSLFSSALMLNVLFTFLLGIIGMYFVDLIKNKYNSDKYLKYKYTTLMLITVVLIGEFINVDYCGFGVATVLVFYIFKNSKKATAFSYISLVILYYYKMSIQYAVAIDWIKVIFTIFPIILIMLYNGKQGRKVKYLFYIFYPLHMLVLYYINQFII